MRNISIGWEPHLHFEMPIDLKTRRLTTESWVQAWQCIHHRLENSANQLQDSRRCLCLPCRTSPVLWYLDIINMRVRRSAIRKTRWTRILFIAYNPVQDPLAPQCVTQHVDQNAVDWSSDYAQVIGRDRYGVFPLRGKILNVSWLTQRGLAFWRHFQKLDDSGCKKIV